MAVYELRGYIDARVTLDSADALEIGRKIAEFEKSLAPLRDFALANGGKCLVESSLTRPRASQAALELGLKDEAEDAEGTPGPSDVRPTN